MPTIDLLKKPTYLRTGITRGISSDEAVSRKGGQFRAGLIRGVAMATRGEALGHRMWLDSDFLDSLTMAVNRSSKGVKARFTHPGLSSDGLGKYLGKFRRAYRDGDIVRADLEFAASAHDTPDGDLASYVMDLAEESPEDFGASIVFEPDYGAEDLFAASNRDEEGDFRSPDQDNEKNYRHARLHRLRATDVVDEPAANPDGLFHVTDIPAEAEELLSYALGLSEHYPALSLGVEPERLRLFVSRFLERHQLTVGGLDMPLTNQNADKRLAEDIEDELEQEEGKEEELAEDTEEDVAAEDDTDTEEDEDDKDDEEMSSRDECKRFIAAFGLQGAEWFADGTSFESATQMHIANLSAENESLKKQLIAARGEAEPLSSGLTEDLQQDDKQKKLASQIGDNRARYAAAIKLRSSKN